MMGEVDGVDSTREYSAVRAAGNASKKRTSYGSPKNAESVKHG